MISIQEILKAIKPYVIGWIQGLLSEWIDYSATSTIVGWSSYNQKQIYYSKVGKRFFVQFYIDGTSNLATTTFTLPFSAGAGYTEIALFGIDNGVGIDCRASFGSSTVTFYTGKSGAGGWTASGTKRIIGQFWGQAA